jgi:hypothetical protein
MNNLDDGTLERIIEQITHQVLIMVQQAPDQSGQITAGTDAPPLSAQDYVNQVQPVIQAGADRIASTLGVAPTDGTMGHMIDHTLLKPDATQDQSYVQICSGAAKFWYVRLLVSRLEQRPPRSKSLKPSKLSVMVRPKWIWSSMWAL